MIQQNAFLTYLTCGKLGLKLPKFDLQSQFPMSKKSVKSTWRCFFSVINTVFQMRGHAKVLLRTKKIVGHPKKN